MQFTKPFKIAIAAGEVTTSFRKWHSARVKAGRTYNIPPYGAIQVDKIIRTSVKESSVKAVRQSGFDSKSDLIEYLGIDVKDPVFLIEFRFIGKASVNQPDTTKLPKDELEHLVTRVSKLAWVAQILTLIQQQPQTRAGDLAPQCGMQLDVFKRNVRRLKSMGLTISHEVGYELSTRGRQLVDNLANIDR